MRIIINLVLQALAVLISAYLIPSVVVDSFLAALSVAVVLGLLNTFLKPLLLLLTLPLNVLTLGLFTLVINTVVVLIASSLVSGFSVDSFWSALLFSLILSLVNFVLSTFK
jgi:putative membrane protein